MAGSLNITMYRDDLYTGLEKPILGVSHIPTSITKESIVIIDDVLFTGRTIRAALQELLDYGRPQRVNYWYFWIVEEESYRYNLHFQLYFMIQSPILRYKLMWPLVWIHLIF